MGNIRIGNSGQASKVLIWGGSLVTLFFWAAFSDPFNAPKSWLLSISGFWLFGWVIFQISVQIKQFTLKLATIISAIYLLTLSVSYLHTDNKYIGFFGEYQRKTGFLSYFCLIIFFLVASYLFRLSNTPRLEIAMMGTGFLTGLYGLLQHFRHDFVRWNNPYNSVLGTLGNPDFAAAVMSIFLIISFGIAIQKKYLLWIRVFAIGNTFLLFIVINYSQVRQGILTAVIGILLITIVWIHQHTKPLAYLFVGLSVSGGIFALVGMLNKGPLVKYFYKVSVTYRGDYWRAGWRMFIHHPIFGVGLDRYGANFRQYRDATQSLRRGPDLVSNAAHSIPIQLAATGGIFVFLAYVSLVIFIFWRGIISIKVTTGDKQMLATIFLAAWIAYQAQSLISIDNLGIVIWGYILGGVVVGNSVITPAPEVRKRKEEILQPVVSGLLSLVLVIISSLFLSAESSSHSLNKLPIPRNQNDLATYERASQKPSEYFFKEPSFALANVERLAQIGNFAKAISEANRLLASDPHSFETLSVLASIYEYQKNWELAAKMRQEIVLIDPFNQKNLLQAGEDQKNIGNMAEAHKIVAMINSFAPNTPEAKMASKDFGASK